MEHSVRTGTDSHVAIELGGGPNPKYHPNVDVLYGDIRQDIRLGLPFADASVDLIWASDFFEHLTFLEGLDCLRECKRVLRPTGMLDWHVPDVEAGLSFHINNGWNYDLAAVLYGGPRDDYEGDKEKEKEYNRHKAWYTPTLLGYILDKEGWEHNIQQATHGWPHQPKMRVKAWPRK